MAKKASVKLYDCFKVGHRKGGETFVTLKANAPEWLQDAVREAHSGTFPNDWIYETIRAVCGAIDDGELSEDDSDAMHSFTDAQVEIYTQKIFQWATDHCLTDMYSAAESEAEELGTEGTVEQRFQRIQYCAIQAIASSIVQSVSEARKAA